MLTSTMTRLFSVVGCYGLFNGFVPRGVIAHKQTRRSFYFFKCFKEDRGEPTGWARDPSKDFIVVGGGKGNVVFEFIEGGSIDILVVHTGMRMIGGGQG